MGSGKGFAALSKQARKLVSAKAGKISQASGAGHKLDKVTAKAASTKGVQARRKKQARAAALRLLEAGFSPEQLFKLNLSEAELIYYGGSKSTGVRIRELVGRWDNVAAEAAASERGEDRTDPPTGGSV